MPDGVAGGDGGAKGGGVDAPPRAHPPPRAVPHVRQPSRVEAGHGRGVRRVGALRRRRRRRSRASDAPLSPGDSPRPERSVGSRRGGPERRGAVAGVHRAGPDSRRAGPQRRRGGAGGHEASRGGVESRRGDPGAAGVGSRDYRAIAGVGVFLLFAIVRGAPGGATRRGAQRSGEQADTEAHRGVGGEPGVFPGSRARGGAVPPLPAGGGGVPSERTG